MSTTEKTEKRKEADKLRAMEIKDRWSKECKLKCGKPAQEGARFADMCFEHYLEHNRACEEMNK